MGVVVGVVVRYSVNSVVIMIIVFVYMAVCSLVVGV